MTNQNEWIIFKNGKEIKLTNIDYLNYLLDNSKKAIEKFDKTRMLLIKWDLQEIKKYTSLFYSLHKLIIDSEIKTLARLIKYDKINHEKSLLNSPD